MDDGWRRVFEGVRLIALNGVESRGQVGLRVGALIAAVLCRTKMSGM